MRKSARCCARGEVPEFARIYDAQIFGLFLQREHLLVAGYQDFRFCINRRTHDYKIVPFAEVQIGQMGWPRLDMIAAKEPLVAFYNVRWHSELCAQGAPKLFDHQLAGQKFVLVEDELQHIGAQASRTERAREHIGVEEDPQDMTSKTSSSVRKPCAAAYGIACRRSLWNSSKARCRFNAERMISLRVRPERLQTSSRIGANSSSIRTVIVFPFMCDMVTHQDRCSQTQGGAQGRVYLTALA